MGVARDVWNTVCRLSKQTLLNIMCDTCKIPNGDTDLLMLSNFPQGMTTFNNVQVLCSCNGALSCTSLSGAKFQRPVCSYFKTWKYGLELHKKQAAVQSHNQDAIVGLCPNESSVMQLLRKMDSGGDVDNTDTLPDLLETTDELSCYFLKINTSLLDKILNNLQAHDIVKWRDFSISSLYHNILQDAQNLNSKCLVKELEIISDAMKSETGRNFYSKSFLKSTNVNIISRAFGCKYDIAGKKKENNCKET